LLRLRAYANLRSEAAVRQNAQKLPRFIVTHNQKRKYAQKRKNPKKFQKVMICQGLVRKFF